MEYTTSKATTIRYPSTANLMVDSADRNETINPYPYDFQIVRTQSLINGYFYRIGTTEVVLEWCEPNMTYPGIGPIVFDISGATTRSTKSVQSPEGNYTVASLLNYICANAGANGVSFAAQVVPSSGYVNIVSTGGKFRIFPGALASLLTLDTDAILETQKPVVGCPDLRPYRFIDIVCPTLTAVQDVKDTTTQDNDRDVLVRWYFSEDVPNPVDSLGFPILMGYLPFQRRRIFNPPKQIKWDNIVPVGNMTFQLYNDQGQLATSITETDTNYLMTLQLSEN